MSIETLIGELIAAVKENTAALIAAQSGGTQVKADAKPTTAKAAIEQALEAAKAQKEAKKETEKAKEQPKEEAKAEETEALSYETDVQPKLTAFLTKYGRDPFFALLKPFGAKKGTELKADDYAAVLAAIDEYELTA